MTRVPLLALDTATTTALVALGGVPGATDDQPLVSSWPAGHRHGEELLDRVAALLSDADLAIGELGGIVVGTGPGAFTGLRVGIATAKGLAHGLRIPLVGIPTGAALLHAASVAPGADGAAVPDDGLALLLPAGPRDRVLVRAGVPSELVPAGREPELEAGVTFVAVDLAGRASDDALARGAVALAGLPFALLALGAARLAAGAGDDLAALVPDYVTLPRGIREATGTISWSHGPR